MPAHASRTLAPASSAPPSRAERRLLAPARPRHRPANAGMPPNSPAAQYPAPSSFDRWIRAYSALWVDTQPTLEDRSALPGREPLGGVPIPPSARAGRRAGARRPAGCRSDHAVPPARRGRPGRSRSSTRHRLRWRSGRNSGRGRHGPLPAERLRLRLRDAAARERVRLTSRPISRAALMPVHRLDFRLHE